MGKLDIIKAFVANPKKIMTMGYQAMMAENKGLNYKDDVKSKYNLEQLPTIDLLDVIPDMKDSIYPYCYLNGTSMVTLMMMMRSLAKKNGACSYLEIGSFRGESLMNLADVAKDCTSITLSKEEMRQMNFPEEFMRMDGMFIKDRPNITRYQQDTKKFDFKKLNNKKFDLILVDGDNSYEGMLHDTAIVYDLLKDENSVIVWHSYAADTENESVRYHVLKGLLDGMPKEEHGHIYHVSNTTSAIFIRGKFAAKTVKAPTYPNKVFKVDVTIEKL